MKCPKCGNYNFDSTGKCTFCSTEAPINAKPPSWWGSKDWNSPPSHKTGKRESDEKATMQQTYICPNCNSPITLNAKFCGNCGIALTWQQPQPPTHQQQQNNYGYGQKAAVDLRRCINCGRNSLWFNTQNGLYECLNTKCGRKFTAYEMTNKQAPLSPKWHKKVGKAKQHGRKVRINGKALFGTLQKILIFAAVIAITALIVTAVCMFISNKLQVYAFIAALILGLIFLGLCLNSFARRRLTFTRFFLVFLFSFIFIILSSAYLDVRTLLLSCNSRCYDVYFGHVWES